MDVITCLMTIGGHVFQTFDNHFEEDGIALRIHMSSYSKQQRRAVLQSARYFLDRENIPWLKLQGKFLLIDAEGMKAEFPHLTRHAWFVGQILVEPEHEPSEREVFERISYSDDLVVYMTQDSIGAMSMAVPTGAPAEIKDSLERFRKDHPDAKRCAFVMMRFGATGAHAEIVESIRETLKPHGLIALRADDKQYHDDLFPNILTYLHGCSFGIAVFERLETDDFNPNVSLEVGYMLAMRKPVCLLKDRTLKTLHTDLVGKLYRTFDPQKSYEGIQKELNAWMRDKEIV